MKTTNTTKRGAATLADVGAALGCNEGSAATRLSVLGYIEPCSRCGGSGHHSRCQQYGTVCFKCRGNGKQIVRLTWTIVDEAKARQDAGELADYFARIAARAEARKQIVPLLANAKAVYDVIADAYEQAYKMVSGKRDAHIAPGLHAAQAMANSLYWGGDENYSHKTGARRIEARIKAGLDAVSAVAQLREIIQHLTTLRDAALPLVPAWLAETEASATTTQLDAA